MKQQFIITDEVGLHARPATLLVNEISKFASDAKISVEGKDANLKSIMGVMALGVKKDMIVDVEITGSDEAEAMDAVENAIIDNKIGHKYNG